jgi:hypothetical protein
MKGTNQIIVNLEPRGIFLEGIINGTPKPGTMVQFKLGTALGDTGRFQFEVFNQTADGKRTTVMVLLADKLQGKTTSDAYADGDRCRVYCPLAGDELNVLKGDVSGTADDFAIGDKLMIDEDTGKVIASTGSPESEPFICLETVTDPTADQLVWVQCTGQ